MRSSRRCTWMPCRRACALAALLRSEEHTSELQSQSNLVCRLLLEKKKKKYVHGLCVYVFYRFLFVVPTAIIVMCDLGFVASLALIPVYCFLSTVIPIASRVFTRQP